MGSVTSYEYTEAGKLVKVIGADGASRPTRWMATASTSAKATAWAMSPPLPGDARNNVTSITDPLGNVTRYTYDDSGNLTTATDANGAVTRYTYDADGRIVSMTDARGSPGAMLMIGTVNWFPPPILSAASVLPSTTALDVLPPVKDAKRQYHPIYL